MLSLLNSYLLVPLQAIADCANTPHQSAQRVEIGPDQQLMLYVYQYQQSCCVCALSKAQEAGPWLKTTPVCSDNFAETILAQGICGRKPICK